MFENILDKKQKELIIKILKNLDDESIVNFQNFYCQVTEEENPIFLMSDFDDLMKDSTPSEILESISPSFNIKDKFFIFSLIGYQSFNDLGFYINYDDLYDFIFDGCHYFILENNIQEMRDEFIKCACEFADFDNNDEFREYLENNVVDEECYEVDWWSLCSLLMSDFQDNK